MSCIFEVHVNWVTCSCHVIPFHVSCYDLFLKICLVFIGYFVSWVLFSLVIVSLVMYVHVCHVTLSCFEE